MSGNMLVNVPCPFCGAVVGARCTRAPKEKTTKPGWVDGVHGCRKEAWLAIYDIRVSNLTAEAIAAWLERAGAPSLSMRVRAGEWKRRAAEEASKP